MAVINPPDTKLAKRTSVEWFEIKLYCRYIWRRPYFQIYSSSFFDAWDSTGNIKKSEKTIWMHRQQLKKCSKIMCSLTDFLCKLGQTAYTKYIQNELEFWSLVFQCMQLTSIANPNTISLHLKSNGVPSIPLSRIDSSSLKMQL